jgi:hypothetical protein
MKGVLIMLETVIIKEREPSLCTLYEEVHRYT